DGVGAGSEVGQDLLGRAAAGGDDKDLVGAVGPGRKTGRSDPIGDPVAIGRKARTAPFRSQQPGISALGRNQIDATAVAVGAESDGCAVGRKCGLAVVSRVTGELYSIAAAGGLHPNVKI